jgi:glycosyltransferase involved in cell wall biosynthesis
MRIWIVSLYEPLPINGIGIKPLRSSILSKFLAALGHEVELWIPGFEHVHHEHYKKESVEELISHNLSVQYLKGFGYKNDISFSRYFHNRTIAREFKKVARLRNKKPDLILTHIPTLELAEAVIDYAKDHDVPVVIDILDLYPDNYKRILPWPLKNAYKILFFNEIKRLKKILRGSISITACSKSYLDWAIKYSGRIRSKLDTVFYLGTDDKDDIHFTEQEVLDIKKRFSIPLNGFYIFFAGTFGLYDLKTIFYCAEIFERNNINDVHFILAGKGAGQSWVEKKANSIKNLSYVGWLSSIDMNLFLEFADVGLAPYVEGALMSMPNKPFDYMASGLPIVNSLRGELNEFITENRIGLFYEGGNSTSLYTAIEYLYKNQEISREMGRRSREIFKNNFTKQSIYVNFSKYLTGLLQAK